MYVEPEPGRRVDAGELISRSFESGTDALLLDESALPASFFDLSSGVAGDLLQKIANYGLRLAVVVPDRSVHSARFQELAREADRGGPCRFFATRREAIDWLEA
jgi:hypothetical protein